VRVGRRVKIQSHSFLCEGVHVDDEAFIGHGVMFINDRLPRSTRDDGALKGDQDWTCEPTHIGRRASIGSNATILCGVRVGAEAMVGAGAVVTKDVPARAVVAGNRRASCATLMRVEVPFLDLVAQHRACGRAARSLFAALDQAAFVGGPAVKRSSPSSRRSADSGM
jgi:tetrahydrodipicolinate N-succinyltransferase